MRKANTIGTLALAGAILCGGIVDGSEAWAQAARSQLPIAPDVSAVDLRGRSWSLRSLRGHPVILSLCPTWCPASRDQMRELDGLQRRYGKSGLVILAVSSEDRETLTSYALGNRLAVPLLSDPSDSVANTFGIRSYPTTFFIGRDGRVLNAAIGTAPQHTQVLAALARRELATPAPSRAGRTRGTSARPTSESKRRARRLMPQRRAAQIAAARRKARASGGVVLLSEHGARVLR